MVPTGSRYSTNWCRTLEDDKWLEVKNVDNFNLRNWEQGQCCGFGKICISLIWVCGS